MPEGIFVVVSAAVVDGAEVVVTSFSVVAAVVVSGCFVVVCDSLFFSTV